MKEITATVCVSDCGKYCDQGCQFYDWCAIRYTTGEPSYDIKCSLFGNYSVSESNMLTRAHNCVKAFGGNNEKESTG